MVFVTSPIRDRCQIAHFPRGCVGQPRHASAASHRRHNTCAPEGRGLAPHRSAHQEESVLALPHVTHALLLNHLKHARPAQLVTKVAHVAGLRHSWRQPLVDPAHNKADLRRSSHHRRLGWLQDTPK
eukprot:326943-Pyramimonas_sp.AAC.1